ncbi:hypothetical protein K435DRAFT_939192 [Dendrothele bispora CBS 962.96]|nr:hypothetical protein K435DRAFT_939192 [Dendrothele bispora CBS 962.96]
MSVNNDVTIDIMQRAQRAVDFGVRGSITETALRRQEADIRSELFSITHRIYFLLEMRDMLMREHGSTIRQLETRLSEEEEEAFQSGKGKEKAVDIEIDGNGDNDREEQAESQV